MSAQAQRSRAKILISMPRRRPKSRPSTPTPIPRPTPELDTTIDASDVFQVSGHAAAVISAADATVSIGQGPPLRAAHDVILHADAASSAQITTRSRYFGITYGSSSPTADVTVDVENGRDRGGSNNVDMQATSAENTLAITDLGACKRGDVAGNISVSYGKARATHSGSVAVREGATITAQSATLDSENTNSVSNMVVAAGFPGSGSVIGIGAGLAIGSYQSDASTDISGNITVAGNLTVESHSTNLRDVTRSFGQVAEAPDAANSLVQALTSFLSTLDLRTNVDDRTSQPADGRGDGCFASRVVAACVRTENKAAAAHRRWLGDCRRRRPADPCHGGRAISDQARRANAADAVVDRRGRRPPWPGHAVANQATAYVHGSQCHGRRGAISLSVTSLAATVPCSSRTPRAIPNLRFRAGLHIA